MMFIKYRCLLLAVVLAILQESQTQRASSKSHHTRVVDNNKSNDVLYKLYSNLTQGYSKYIRPYRNWSNATQVNFEMALLEVIGLEENNGKISVRVWLRMDWFDHYLVWRPEDYRNAHKGIDTIYLSASEVWMPDIDLLNAVEAHVEKDVTVTVNHMGHVTLILPAIYKMTCQHRFKTNTWECPFQFASWSYDESQILLVPKSGIQDMKIDLSRYSTSDYWAVMKTDGSYDKMNRPCCKTPWTLVKLNLHLRGKLGPSLVR